MTSTTTDTQAKELPQIPAWLNLDALVSPTRRAEIREIIKEGEALAPTIAEWAIAAQALLETELPDDTSEFPEVMTLTGLGDLNNVFFLLGELAGHPAGTPGPQQREAVRAKYPEFGELIYIGPGGVRPS
jgi:hypothetical protein